MTSKFKKGDVVTHETMGQGQVYGTSFNRGGALGDYYMVGVELLNGLRIACKEHKIKAC